MHKLSGIFGKRTIDRDFLAFWSVQIVYSRSPKKLDCREVSGDSQEPSQFSFQCPTMHLFNPIPHSTEINQEESEWSGISVRNDYVGAWK